jgi:O-acetyl-ADP-ribose deacetylase (regulator of RNase III)/catechol 2,3-dioxygenase-like lactoylglutathione lyase family enzyme
VSIEYIAGDLFANTIGARAFAHGCNCQGSMGAGIATGFRERYPQMYEQFRSMCKAKPREFNLGDVWLWKAEDRPWVFNLGTQEKIWHARASYEAIETALTKMRALADAEDVGSIAMPRIGVGYGGLSWKKVKVIVERVFGNWAGRLIVYETFVPTDSPDAATVATPPETKKPKKSSRVPAFRMRAITIACTDVKRSTEFYATILGATRLPTDNGIGHWFRLGEINITLLPNAATRTPATFPADAMMMMWLEVDDLAKTAKRFAAHGVDVVDEGDGQFMMVADPDGLVIEVWESEKLA